MRTKLHSCLSAAAFLVSAVNSPAEVKYLDHQHMDFRIQYLPTEEGSNRLDIILGYDQGTAHFTATNHEVYIVGANSAKLTIPVNASYAFLGQAGAPIWILPQTQNASLPYLGTSAEDVPTGIFDGPVTFQLVSVEGPGNFFVWQTSGAGNPPIIKMIFTNGVVSPDFNSTTPLTGSHEHFNWGFSTNGLYRVTFRCVAKLAGQTTNIVGRDVAWAFQILPLRPWESWVSTNWLPATESNIAGVAADPDNDTVPNLIEYALGLNPNVASTDGLPTFSFITVDDASYGALNFTRVKAATDVSYEPVVSDEIGGTQTILTNAVSVIDQGEIETVILRDFRSLNSTTNRFYQFGVRLFYP